jgi:hypothetical protein
MKGIIDLHTSYSEPKFVLRRFVISLFCAFMAWQQSWVLKHLFLSKIGVLTSKKGDFEITAAVLLRHLSYFLKTRQELYHSLR